MHRILTIILALIIDLTFGDPPNRFHPVVLMGNWLSTGRRVAPIDNRFWFGAGWITTGIALFSLPFFALKKFSLITRHSPLHLHPSSFILHPLLLTPVFAYRNLRQSVAKVADALSANNLLKARQLTAWHLVSRDTSQLTETEVAGAAIESLAENITDSLTAPLLAYTIGGLPAAWAYRFINTSDAMWGYRTPEFEQLGKFPAVLDDVFNWIPARLTGWLLVISARLAGENAAQSRRAMLSEHQKTSSPNAGWTMGAMAGALNVTLTKQGVYQLAGGPAQPNATAIHRALRVADICVGLVVITLAAISLVRWRDK